MSDTNYTLINDLQTLDTLKKHLKSFQKNIVVAKKYSSADEIAKMTEPAIEAINKLMIATIEKYFEV